MLSLLTHLLGVALPLLVVPTLILLACLRWGREAFRGDYPPDVQEAMPPATAGQRWVAVGLAGAFLLTLLGAVLLSTVVHLRDDPGRGYGAALAAALLTMLAFGAIDLVIVDWMVICAWRPRWVVIPGTEQCRGWGDYAFHARVLAAPKAVAANLALPAIIAALALWIA